MSRCLTKMSIPIITMITMFVSLLFVSGTLDPHSGLGQKLFIGGVVIFCIFTGVVMIRPSKIYLGGCENLKVNME